MNRSGFLLIEAALVLIVLGVVLGIAAQSARTLARVSEWYACRRAVDCTVALLEGGRTLSTALDACRNGVRMKVSTTNDGYLFECGRLSRTTVFVPFAEVGAGTCPWFRVSVANGTVVATCPIRACLCDGRPLPAVNGTCRLTKPCNRLTVEDAWHRRVLVVNVKPTGTAGGTR